ncbi:hypothetical protein ASF71_21085 [Deinococcus sp. Leaf326]|nr:hypothetical protein ASF71_21085 [Deinococcus sp. Leaf326]
MHDVRHALGFRYIAQAVVGMTHPADGEDNDGRLIGDAAVGMGAVVVLIGANPLQIGEPQGVDEGLVVCGVGDAADEGEGAALDERPCCLYVMRQWGVFCCHWGFLGWKRQDEFGILWCGDIRVC